MLRAQEALHFLKKDYMPRRKGTRGLRETPGVSISLFILLDGEGHNLPVSYSHCQPTLVSTSLQQFALQLWPVNLRIWPIKVPAGLLHGLQETTYNWHFSALRTFSNPVSQ